MSSQLKQQLLAKYSEKEPTLFLQIDGFGPEQCDSVIHDIGGFGAMAGETHELMSGRTPVRVLIIPGTDPLLVSKILKCADEWYPSLCCNDEPGSVDAAISRIATACFFANIGEDEFMSMNVESLVAFRERHQLSQDDMNTAWRALQQRCKSSTNKHPFESWLDSKGIGSSPGPKHA